MKDNLKLQLEKLEKDNAASPGGRRNKGLFAGLLGIDGAPSGGAQRRGGGGGGDRAGADDGGGFVVMIGEHGGKASRSFTPIAHLGVDTGGGSGRGMLDQLRRSYKAKDASSSSTASKPGSRPTVKVGKRLRDEIAPKQKRFDHPSAATATAAPSSKGFGGGGGTSNNDFGGGGGGGGGAPRSRGEGGGGGLYDADFDEAAAVAFDLDQAVIQAQQQRELQQKRQQERRISGGQHAGGEGGGDGSFRSPPPPPSRRHGTQHETPPPRHQQQKQHQHQQRGGQQQQQQAKAQADIATTEMEIAGKIQRLGELQAQTTQALMEGYEVPQKLQEERQGLETAIAGLGKTLRALKATAAAESPSSQTSRGARTPLGNLPMTGGDGDGGGGGGHTFVMRTQQSWGSPPPAGTPRDRYAGGGSGGADHQRSPALGRGAGGYDNSYGGSSYDNSSSGGYGGGGGSYNNSGGYGGGGGSGNTGGGSGMSYESGGGFGGGGSGGDWGGGYGGQGGGNSYNDNDDGCDGTPLCEHGERCVKLTSMSENNPGREFYKCPLPKNGGEQCGFFEWLDGEGNGGNRPSGGGGLPGGVANGKQLDIRKEVSDIFGHAKFRTGQEEVIVDAMKGKDVFVLMPTGGGKSLCYQLPACCCPGLAVVFSPLISLVQDQVAQMRATGVEAAYINSEQDYDSEVRVVMDQLYRLQDYGGLKLLYITPEKFCRSPSMNKALQRLHSKGLLSRFVIDEAHCVSE
ncbi:unnamed protein product [Ectocarpus sp. 13 AM-2016]